MGTQAYQAKRYQEAAQHFEAAAALRPSAVALYTAGMAWDLASRPERAADAYVRANDLGGLDAKQVSLSKERVAHLEKTTLGTVIVTAPDGWKVQLDAFTEAPTPARLHGAPGLHSISVHAPGAAIEQHEITLEAGRVTSFDVKTASKPQTSETVPTTEQPLCDTRGSEFWSARRGVGAAVTGVGVAVLGGALALGFQANKAKDAYNAGPTRLSYDHASSLQTWTNIALISGAVLFVGGVTLVVWPAKERGYVSHAKLSVAPSLGGAVLGGEF